MGLEEILKQVEETGKEKAAAIRKETVEEVEAKMKEASKDSENVVSQIKSERNLFSNCILFTVNLKSEMVASRINLITLLAFLKGTPRAR